MPIIFCVQKLSSNRLTSDELLLNDKCHNLIYMIV